MAGGVDAEQSRRLGIRSVGCRQAACRAIRDHRQDAASHRLRPRAIASHRTFDQHGARGARGLQALPLQRSAIDDVAEIGLADLGAVKAQRAASARRRRPHPRRTCVHTETPGRAAATARSPHSLSTRSEARLSANTRRSQSAPPAGRRAASRVGNQRHAPGRAQLARQQQARHRPRRSTPAPTMITSNRRLARRSSQAPRRARAWECGRRRRC